VKIHNAIRVRTCRLIYVGLSPQQDTVPGQDCAQFSTLQAPQWRARLRGALGE